jgi:hypothetical protein
MHALKLAVADADKTAAVIASFHFFQISAKHIFSPVPEIRAEQGLTRLESLN